MQEGRAYRSMHPWPTHRLERCMKIDNRLSLRPTALASMLMCALAALPAVAQQAARADEDPGQQVVITANKRLEKQRDVAGTVSVLTGAELERRGARDQEDIFKLTPGVQLNRGDPNGNTISIRGLASQAAPESGGLQQTPTGRYLEDVPLVSPAGKGIVADIVPFDLDRLEVLRGPQGALFGSGSLGGAVRYLFGKPNLKAFDAAVQFSGASVAEGKTAGSIYAMVNAPLASTAAVRAVVFDATQPGYIDNKGTNNKDTNALTKSGGRIMVTVQPSRSLSATFTGASEKTSIKDFSYVFGDSKKLEHDNPTLGRNTTQLDFASLNVEADLGAMSFTSLTGYWKTKGTTVGDDTRLFGSLGLPIPLVTRSGSGSTDATSQEFRLSSKPGGALSWVAGVFYQSSSGSTSSKQSDPTALFGVVDLVDLVAKVKGQEQALFADGEYTLGGGWSVGLGGRYYKTKLHYSQTGTVFGGPSNDFPDDTSDSGVTPKASIKYRFGDNQWYALASKGYRYGGNNSGATASKYKSDSLWNYETGVRLNPAKGVQLDLTAFLLDWKDAQFSYFEQRGQIPFSGIGNVGKARSTGLEAALRWRLNEAFDVNASLASIDAKTTADVAVPAGRGSALVKSGARLPGTARLQTALQGNYRFAGPLGSAGRFNLTHTHVGSRTFDLTAFYSAPGYDTVDMGLSFAKDNWTLSATVDNAADKRGISNIQGTPAGGAFAQYYLQRPRSVTVTLRYDY
jgi:iron complex outermembrane recepter protein